MATPRFRWSQNWKGSFARVSEDQRKIFKKEILKGGSKGGKLRVIVTAAGWPAVEYAKFFHDRRGLFELGVPVDSELVAVFAENPLLSLEHALEINAHNRFYWDLAETELPRGSREELAKMDPEVLRFCGQLLEEFVYAPQQWCEAHGIPFGFCDPHSLEGEMILREATGGSEHPYNCRFFIPWGRWVGWESRRLCGELSYPYETRRGIRRRLFEDGAGLCGGLHPTDEHGGRTGLEWMHGSKPFDRVVEERLSHARLAMIGAGPVKMDDPDLLVRDGERFEFGVDFGKGPISKERKRELVRQLLRRVADEMIPTLRSTFVPALADRIVQMVGARKRAKALCRLVHPRKRRSSRKP